MRCVAASLLSALLATACSLPSQPAFINPGSAQRIAEHTFGLPLRQLSQPDTPSLANIVATYSGSRNRTRVIVIVFDSALATRQLTGGTSTAVTGSQTLVRSDNVVLMYHHAGIPPLTVQRSLEDAASSG